MKTMAATGKHVIKIPENETIDSGLLDRSDESHEKAIHDWENEGGALGMHGSSSSIKEWCESEIFAPSLHWESKGVPEPDAAAQGRIQAHDPVCPHCINRDA